LPHIRTYGTAKAYIEIARPDHWIKNVFVLPGFVVALSIDRGSLHALSATGVLTGLLAVCMVSSSNYVLNEILDAPSDRVHPHKSTRPVAAGRVWIPAAYFEWILLVAVGLWMGCSVSRSFTAALFGLWIAGCVYNVPPLRLKDVPYLDVLSEGITNPLRMLAGWYLTKSQAAPITSLLIGYWMVGCYFMAIKRYAECREFTPEVLSSYRKSFRFYSEQRLLTSILFYGSQGMLFLGAFIVRYRLELILCFPLVAFVMASYFNLAFQPNSPVQRPEGLYREPLVVAVLICAIVMAVLLFVDIPILHKMFPPTHSSA
jgi:4-hydroxybenzoate polyprenyltransferase